MGIILVLVGVMGRGVSFPPPSFPGDPGPLGGGGSGSPRVTYVTLAAPSPSPRPAVDVVTIPVVREIPVSIPEPQPLAQRVLSEVVAPPTGSAGGPGSGAGTGGGEGSGVGPGVGPGTGGTGGDVFPPQPRYSILPPLPKPAAVRGKSFQVHFWVSASGRVTQVRVSPEIPDGGYRKKFLALMYEYTFAPARRLDGTPVAGETTITVRL